MDSQAMLLELLVSGFFAVACFRARAGEPGGLAVRPRDMLQLTDRLERLRRTRWQWFAMVLVIVLFRLESGLPLLVELTVMVQFVLFLAWPAQKKVGGSGKDADGRGLKRLLSSRIGSARMN